MKTINIVAGGPDHLIPDLLQYQAGDALWVGVDRGAVTLLDAGIVPDEAFGDFDSITDEQKKAYGGVNKNTARQCIEAGANLLVAGSAVYNEKDRKKAISDIKGALG
ncbi:hypothetical protein DT075_24655 [Bacillus licheniformis]|nr:hypothetical protein DT075_24655 [Bacillus licheniformis]